MHPEIKNR